MASMDFFALLQEDHREVKSLLAQLIQRCRQEEKVSAAQLETFRSALILHLKLEEKYLYPKAQDEQTMANLVVECYEAHRHIQNLLQDLDTIQQPAHMADRLKEVQRHLERHLQQEEDELFPLLHRHWDEQTIHDISEKMQTMKQRELRAR